MKNSNRRINKRKPKVYKVWIEIEEHDPNDDSYISLDLPFASVAACSSEKEALRVATLLQTMGEGLTYE